MLVSGRLHVLRLFVHGGHGVDLWIYQAKTLKMKPIAFVAGVSQYCCFFTAFGDDLVMNRRPLSDDGVSDWLHPHLRENNSPGKKLLGFYMKALLPRDRGGLDKYADYAVADLPDGINAGGLRPGAVNALVPVMPAELLERLRAMIVMAPARCTRTWARPSPCLCPVLPPWPRSRRLFGVWGRLGFGPVHASLEALRESADSSRFAAIDQLIIELFVIDSTYPPAFRKNGKLRPALEAACASLIMYYETRQQKSEMQRVQACLRDAWGAAFNVLPGQAHQALIAAGKLIRARFDVDSLRLTSPPTSIELTPIVRAVRQLSTTLENKAPPSTNLKSNNCNFALSSRSSRPSEHLRLWHRLRRHGQRQDEKHRHLRYLLDRHLLGPRCL